MQNRGLLLIVMTASLAGCANEQVGAPQLAMSPPATMLGASSIAREHDADMKRAAKQTVSAKMLAAIVLQRVTGRIADPARFNELR